MNPTLKVEVVPIGRWFPRFLIAETGLRFPRYYTGDQETVWSCDPDEAILYAHLTLVCADAAALQNGDAPGGAR